LHLAHGDAEGAPTGAHFENLVLCDLLAWRDTQVRQPEITYWRTSGGHEVDFVIAKKRLLGVEVKAAKQPGMRDIAGLRTFLAEHPKQALGGVVVHGGSESYWLDDRIVAVPWWRVL
jgi:predicted AAA+ superfamily ATPase